MQKTSKVLIFMMRLLRKRLDRKTDEVSGLTKKLRDTDMVRSSSSSSIPSLPSIVPKPRSAPVLHSNKESDGGESIR